MRRKAARAQVTDVYGSLDGSAEPRPGRRLEQADNGQQKMASEYHDWHPGSLTGKRRNLQHRIVPPVCEPSSWGGRPHAHQNGWVPHTTKMQTHSHALRFPAPFFFFMTR